MEIKICDDTSVEEMGSHDKSCYVKNGLSHEFDVLHDFTSDMDKMTEELTLKHLFVLPNETWKTVSGNMSKSQNMERTHE